MEKNIKFKLIIGLGNPGSAYKNTYHNAGIQFIDYLKALNSGDYIPLASKVFMNKSGQFVAKEIKKAGAKPEELLIVHDDSDLKLGTYKFQFGRGAAGHKGVQNVIDNLKTKNFWRLRIGIRSIGPKKAGEFVLKKITREDRKILEAVFQNIVFAI
jgi:PTH1 family peptidyl-tRNA hydrolase